MLFLCNLLFVKLLLQGKKYFCSLSFHCLKYEILNRAGPNILSREDFFFLIRVVFKPVLNIFNGGPT